MHIREGTPGDLSGILAILAESPEAAQWDPLGYSLLVAEVKTALAGFLAFRKLADDEAEILNLAVFPQFRKRGVAQALLQALPAAQVFLEVRESNAAARALYRKAGYQQVGIRPGYYEKPNEAAIVMRLQS